MSAKKTTRVIIDQKIYTVSGYEEEEYLLKLASYINDKIEEFALLEGYNSLSIDYKNALLALNIADDYFKAKDSANQSTFDMERKEKEIYDLKHDLVSEQVKNENYEEKLAELENQIKELTFQKNQLEASLEEAMLG